MNNEVKKKIRLFVSSPLREGAELLLPEASSHYLCNVMRLQNGQVISCFNAVDGEFDCHIENIHKKQCRIKVEKKIRSPQPETDLWLLFAPVKKEQTDFIIEKATELGVSKIIPVITARTIVGSVRTERFAARAVEAAEQCGRISIPQIAVPLRLEEALNEWDAKRLLFFMDEKGKGVSCREAFGKAQSIPAAVLTGPEGGFSEEEANMLYRKPFVRGVSLGPRILRAETAVVAALSVWQAVAGDWNPDKGEKK